MLEILTQISAVIGILYTANLINRFSSIALHWLKFKSLPMSEVETELKYLKENHRGLVEEYETLKQENEELTTKIIKLIPTE